MEQLNTHNNWFTDTRLMKTFSVAELFSRKNRKHHRNHALCPYTMTDVIITVLSIIGTNEWISLISIINVFK